VIEVLHAVFGAKHAIEPKDAGKLVEISNALAKAVAHPIAYIHMPVPIARSDAAYFKIGRAHV